MGNTWSLVSRQGPGRLPPRTLHAAVYDDVNDIIYVHGGSDLNDVLEDTLMYNFTSNKWDSVDDKHQYSEVFDNLDDLNDKRQSFAHM